MIGYFFTIKNLFVNDP